MLGLGPTNGPEEHLEAVIATVTAMTCHLNHRVYLTETPGGLLVSTEALQRQSGARARACGFVANLATLGLPADTELNTGADRTIVGTGFLCLAQGAPTSGIAELLQGSLMVGGPFARCWAGRTEQPEGRSQKHVGRKEKRTSGPPTTSEIRGAVLEKGVAWRHRARQRHIVVGTWALGNSAEEGRQSRGKPGAKP